MGTPSERCAACGDVALEPHMAVRGRAGGGEMSPASDDYGQALGDISRCRTCGHRQVTPMPERAQLVSEYAAVDSGDHLSEQRGQRLTARRVLADIERHVPRGALLDIGCWVGFLLDEARARGWSTVGIEPSGFAASHARAEIGLDVREQALDDVALPPASFDAAFMGDVIEHLPDPARSLSRVHGWLRPGGVIALALPDAGSRLARALGRRWWSVLPTHVQYFTPASLSVLLDRTGFRIVAARTAPKTFSIRYYVTRLRGYAPRSAAALERACEAIGIAERQVTPDFRDRMLVVARRLGP